MFSDLVYRLRVLFRRKSVETELNDELRFHLERQAEKYVRAGLTQQEAYRRARIEFGGLEQVKEVCREVRGVHLLETTVFDVRYGLRMLRKSPGFTFVAVLTLALGIGANTAIFSVANPVLFRPLPFRDPSRLVTVLEAKPSQNLDWLFATQISFVEWQRRATAFESLAAYRGCGYRLAEDGEPHFLSGACVTSTFFPMMGIQPILGRTWTAEEDIPGRDHVALLSYSAWKQHFGGDPNVIGRKIWRIADRENYQVIGVLPPDFQFVSDRTEVWAPSGINTAAPTRFHELMVFARLKPNVTLQQAQASMDGIARDLDRELPKSNKGWTVTVQGLQQYYSGLSSTRATLLVLLTAVGALLLIACANVANLLLARSTARQQEIAVRVAMGAWRARLVRQLLTESLLLGLLGGVAGFAMAWAGFDTLIAMVPRIPSFQPNAIRIDAQVFFFSLVASLGVTILFGLAPALRATRTNTEALLRQSARGALGSFRDRLMRRLLVVSEIGLAMVLLIGTALLVESLRNLQKDRLGFDADHMLTMGVCCLDETQYPGQPEISSFYRKLFERLRGVPGVEAVTATSGLPVRQFDGGGSPFLVQGRPVPAPGHDTLSDSRFIEPSYFSSMRIPLLRGRYFTEEDDENHPPVMVINEAMQRRFFPDQDPIDQHIQLVNVLPAGRWYTVIGVAANSRDRGLGKDTRPMVYISDLQTAVRDVNLLVRTKSDPHTVEAGIRSTAKALRQDLSIRNVKMLDEVLSESLASQRFSVTLLTLFTVLALGLAVVGVYGVMAYTVAQRTREIGLRIALGAQPRNMMMLVVGQGVKLALAGIAAGLVGALAATRLMNSLLFNISPRDPSTAAFVAAVLLAVALLACYIPARRAMRVDPMVALRCE